MKKPLLYLLEGIQWLKWGVLVNESLLFGVRVRLMLEIINGHADKSDNTDAAENHGFNCKDSQKHHQNRRDFHGFTSTLGRMSVWKYSL